MRSIVEVIIVVLVVLVLLFKILPVILQVLGVTLGGFGTILMWVVFLMLAVYILRALFGGSRSL